jgi:hypothetical protein
MPSSSTIEIPNSDEDEDIEFNEVVKKKSLNEDISSFKKHQKEKILQNEKKLNEYLKNNINNNDNDILNDLLKKNKEPVLIFFNIFKKGKSIKI